MEPDTGTATGADRLRSVSSTPGAAGSRAKRLRPLNQPSAVGVKVSDGVPSEVLWRGTWRCCSRVEEVWRVEDGWWRPRPIRRTYFRLALEDSLVLTLYLDQIDGRWWTQKY
jgi:hypothetical protein